MPFRLPSSLCFESQGISPMELIRILLLAVISLLLFRGTQVQGFLVPHFYIESCPHVERIVRYHVEIALRKDPHTAASLLRLHFHDCFVMGCDGSVLLDGIDGIGSEKEAVPNLNSIKGFEVIDKIKAHLEEACPYTVSCADILAIVARDAVELRGGPRWEVELGRRDSLKPNLIGANELIPAPNFSLEMLIANFAEQGLDIRDLVTLSGGHTIGKARCVNFRQRIYNEFGEVEPDYHKRNTIFRRILRSICPYFKRDDALVPLDFVTSEKFDNHYYHNLIQGKGLLGTDNVLLAEDHEGEITKLVWAYAADQKLFFKEFAKSMLRMGSISPLIGVEGEIRRNCRVPNI